MFKFMILDENGVRCVMMFNLCMYLYIGTSDFIVKCFDFLLI